MRRNDASIIRHRGRCAGGGGAHEPFAFGQKCALCEVAIVHFVHVWPHGPEILERACGCLVFPQVRSAAKNRGQMEPKNPQDTARVFVQIQPPKQRRGGLGRFGRSGRARRGGRLGRAERTRRGGRFGRAKRSDGANQAAQTGDQAAGWASISGTTISDMIWYMSPRYEPLAMN